MTDKRNWSQDEIYSLISHWELYPELWNAKHLDYRNKEQKQNAIHALATMFDTNDHEIQRKLHNLRTQFHHEARKQKEKRNDGCENNYKAVWNFFKPMSFILSNSSSSKQSNSLATNNTKKEKQSNHIEIEVIDKEPSIDSLPIQYKKRKKFNHNHKTNREEVIKNVMRVVDKSTDDFKIFGDFVAAELRNLRSRNNQNKLKRMIQRAILEVSELDDSLLDDNEEVYDDELDARTNMSWVSSKSGSSLSLE